MVPDFKRIVSTRIYVSAWAENERAETFSDILGSIDIIEVQWLGGDGGVAGWTNAVKEVSVGGQRFRHDGFADLVTIQHGDAIVSLFGPITVVYVLSDESCVYGDGSPAPAPEVMKIESMDGS